MTTPFHTFRPCSGQRSSPKSKYDWGVCLVDESRAPWWRLDDATGRQRKFASYETAAEIARQLDADQSLAIPPVPEPRPC